MENRHGIGGNLPPSDAEALFRRLEESNNDLIARHQELIGALSRLPETCGTEDQAKNLTTYGIQIKTCMDSLEVRRKIEKAPYDQLASTVHNFFKGKIDDLDAAVMKVKGLIKAYNDRQAVIAANAAAEARRVADELARTQREAAQKLLDDAAALEAKGKTASASVVLAQAHEAEKAAEAAQVQASAPMTVAPTMLRAEGGGSSGSSGRWKAEIVDVKQLDLEALREYFDLASLQKALNAKMKVLVKTVKSGDDCQQVKGARIFRDSTVTLRS